MVFRAALVIPALVAICLSACGADDGPHGKAAADRLDKITRDSRFEVIVTTRSGGFTVPVYQFFRGESAGVGDGVLTVTQQHCTTTDDSDAKCDWKTETAHIVLVQVDPAQVKPFDLPPLPSDTTLETKGHAIGIACRDDSAGCVTTETGRTGDAMLICASKAACKEAADDIRSLIRLAVAKPAAAAETKDVPAAAPTPGNASPPQPETEASGPQAQAAELGRRIDTASRGQRYICRTCKPPDVERMAGVEALPDGSLRITADVCTFKTSPSECTPSSKWRRYRTWVDLSEVSANGAISGGRLSDTGNSGYSAAMSYDDEDLTAGIFCADQKTCAAIRDDLNRLATLVQAHPADFGTAATPPTAAAAPSRTGLRNLQRAIQLDNEINQLAMGSQFVCGGCTPRNYARMTSVALDPAGVLTIGYTRCRFEKRTKECADAGRWEAGRDTVVLRDVIPESIEVQQGETDKGNTGSLVAFAVSRVADSQTSGKFVILCRDGGGCTRLSQDLRELASLARPR
ncbi:MAG: hypothetical protein GC201_04415 [Alphaproteobacteria bacterium]|nr:hypothetical protein [Alphaproteobacteria bacterium]